MTERNTGCFGGAAQYVVHPKPETLEAISAEVYRARGKFPGREKLLAALMEEVGELAQAMLRRKPLEEIRKEACRVACMAIRLCEEGDSDFDEPTWDAVGRELKAESEIIVPSCSIAAGVFWMGAEGNREAFDDEKPRHRVQITRPFELMTTPVTQALYEHVSGKNPSSRKDPKAPVTDVSWFDAVAFANALSERMGLPKAYAIDSTEVRWDRGSTGYRLPTEAEWEYACRAGTEAPRYGPLDAIAWYNKNSDGRTHAVGEKAPNAWGLHDMIGNVWDWCWDWKASYSSGEVSDPAVSAEGSYRVARGGSWRGDARSARAADRAFSPTGSASGALGFRLARYAP